MPSFSHFETQKAPRLCYFSKSEFQIFLHTARYWNTGVSKALTFQHISVSHRLRKKITKYVCVFQYHVSLHNETQESQRRWSSGSVLDQFVLTHLDTRSTKVLIFSLGSSEDGPHTLRQRNHEGFDLSVDSSIRSSLHLTQEPQSLSSFSTFSMKSSSHRRLKHSKHQGCNLSGFSTRSTLHTLAETHKSLISFSADSNIRPPPSQGKITRLW